MGERGWARDRDQGGEMAFVLTAKWTAKEGEEEAVLNALRSLVGPSRAEPGCLYYQPCRDPEHPRVFLIFEVYADEDAYKQHAESAHFQEHGVPTFPLLESRERAFYETVA
jgi:quinol monooxygenase YgiN